MWRGKKLVERDEVGKGCGKRIKEKMMISRANDMIHLEQNKRHSIDRQADRQTGRQKQTQKERGRRRKRSVRGD